MTKGAVEAKVFAIDGPIPKLPRKSGYTRKSDIDDALEVAAKENAVGVAVCIRQYDKKESASGTLYNLRKRQKNEENPTLTEWEFDVGDLTPFGMEGKTGLFATRTA